MSYPKILYYGSSLAKKKFLISDRYIGNNFEVLGKIKNK
jgi:hypothetical protein